jgi:hypothetical protein
MNKYVATLYHKHDRIFRAKLVKAESLTMAVKIIEENYAGFTILNIMLNE